MTKKVVKEIKLQLPTSAANPASSVGPIVGTTGINIIGFYKEFNTKMKDQNGIILPMIILVYTDNTFRFILESLPAAVLLKKAAAIEKISGISNHDKIRKVTITQVTEIANIKKEDLNVNSVEQAAKIIEGTARNMGIEVTK
jgi:large subunit ribosomal protein L11